MKVKSMPLESPTLVDFKYIICLAQKALYLE